MKKQIEKYRWIIILGGFIILNVSWIIYTNEANDKKVYLSETAQSVGKEDYEGNSMNSGVDEIETSDLQIEKVVFEENEKEDKQIKIATEEDKQMIGIDEKTDNSTVIVEEVPVYICGEIVNPGVYYVPIDTIIYDVIEKSGGFTNEADQLAVNLASPIQPNEKIIIPKEGEEIDKLVDSYDNRERIETSPSAEVTSKDQSQCINLNHASKEELMTLNGIGEVKAAAIIAYRQENGGFNSVDEIKNISGIGEKTFEKIKQFITT